MRGLHLSINISDMAKFSIILTLTSLTIVAINGQQGFNSVPASERQFRVAYEWNTIDFAFGSEQLRSNAIFSGAYIPQNNIISDVKAYRKRLYLSIPRMLPGVPTTLGYVIQPENNGRTDPEIEPYPSWEMNEKGNCSALQFVQGIAIDANGILWAVDSGRLETLVPGGRSKFSCIPKIVMLDLKQDGRVIHRFEFPEDVAARGTNYLNKIVIDDAFGGYAYITDNSGADPGIVVYSRKLNRSWKVREPNSMRAAINAVEFAVNRTSLSFSIHIDGIALGPYYNPSLSGGISSPIFTNAQSNNYERNVYYSPLSSYHLYSLPASILRDPLFADRASPKDVFEAVTDHGVKTSQTDGMIMDNHGLLYYSLLGAHAIAQWDSYKPFTPENQNIVAKDETYIQWIDGMGFDEEGNLYAVMNRLHNFVAGRLNPNEVNFRILKSKTGSLSYVYTNGNTIDPLLADNAVYIHESTFNGFTNGISSTTPTYSSLGSFGRAFGNGAARHGAFMVYTIITTVILALILK